MQLAHMPRSGHLSRRGFRRCYLDPRRLDATMLRVGGSERIESPAARALVIVVAYGLGFCSPGRLTGLTGPMSPTRMSR